MAAVPSADSYRHGHKDVIGRRELPGSVRSAPPKSNRVYARVPSRAPLTGMSVFYH